jgi:predicted DCC family thiol-disulfide oxidoreductase YuxK
LTTESANSKLYYIYDGECPLCKAAALGYRIRKTVGELILLDARTEVDNSVVIEATKLKLDFDKAMVVKYGGTFYCGADALTLMALFSTRQNWFNRMNAALFSHRLMAKFCYPILRFMRNLFIFMRGKNPIGNLD